MQTTHTRRSFAIILALCLLITMLPMHYAVRQRLSAVSIP